MNRENITFFYSWFYDYVKKYQSADFEVHRNIELKQLHTINVCENIKLIGKSLDLQENDLYIAEAIALFHDIGRFEQFRKYNTFNDRISENHALLGVRILKEGGVLSSLPEKKQDIILKAIKYHNLAELPRDEDAECLFFSKLVRDADKLDVLDVITGYYKNREKDPNPSLDFGLSDLPYYSNEFIEDILNSRVSKNRDFKTINDFKLFYLCWVFDINFPFTLSRIYEKRYIEKIIGTMPDEENISKIYRHLKNYIEKHLKNKPVN